MRVSHETIYLTLFVQARGALKRELRSICAAPADAPSRAAHASERGTGQIVDGDLDPRATRRGGGPGGPGPLGRRPAVRAGNSHIATLVERHTRFVMLVRLDGKDTEHVVDCADQPDAAAAERAAPVAHLGPRHEMADHKRFTVATDVQVYFCDPQSPWQRGSNENTNGLLRQYFPKGNESPPSPRPSSTRSPASSTVDLERPWTGGPGGGFNEVLR